MRNAVLPLIVETAQRLWGAGVDLVSCGVGVGDGEWGAESEEGVGEGEHEEGWESHLVSGIEVVIAVVVVVVLLTV